MLAKKISGRILKNSMSANDVDDHGCGDDDGDDYVDEA